MIFTLPEADCRFGIIAAERVKARRTFMTVSANRDIFAVIADYIFWVMADRDFGKDMILLSGRRSLDNLKDCQGFRQ
jgi:hypothetical protein